VPLLNAKYSLLGIADVEAFTGRIVERSGLQLSVTDREELHVYLIEECWLLSRRYDGSRGSRFSAWARATLRLRCIDWQRSRWGRTRWTFSDGSGYERELPQLVSLNDPERDRLEQTQPGSGLERDASGFAADMRALDARGCRPGRRDDYLGDEAA
jgi:DNA-directed RNA polymerase specialized sigma24 family protein